MNTHPTDPRATITSDSDCGPCARVAGIPWRGFAKERARLDSVLALALDLLPDRQKEPPVTVAAHAGFPVMGPCAEVNAANRSVLIKDASIGLEVSPDVSGLVARINGTVNYVHRCPTPFDAVLQNNDGNWRLVSLDLATPSD